MIAATVVTLLSYVYSLSFSVLISVSSLFLINTVLALFVGVARIFQIGHYHVVQLCSSVLAVWFSIFMGHLEHFGCLTLTLTGDAFFVGEPALVVCNHRSWMDTVILYSLARQVRMHGDIKFLAKRSLLAVPIYGFSGWVLDVVIFIQRHSTAAGRRMGLLFTSLTDPRRNGWPYWLVNYLEGTRFTVKKRDAAQDFAKKRDLKQLRHVLQPRTKGFIATIRALRGSLSAVYDVTIGYDEDGSFEIVPSFKEMYFTTSPSKKRIIHVHQRRIPLSELPDDEDKLRDWVYKLYEQKDELIDRFKRTGSFSDRPLRWNRISILYWVWCQFSIYGSFTFFAYLTYRLVRVL